MTAPERFHVAILWHMHQPQYRDALSGEQVLPWTWLHAIKDYVDMVAHLEANPRAQVVVNFAPVLIEQIEELAAAVKSHLAGGMAMLDPVLTLLTDRPLPVEPAQRMELARACLRAHRTHLIGRYPAYAALAELADTFADLKFIDYASEQYLRDLGVWFHLAWLGETVKRSDMRIEALLQQERGFSSSQRRRLLELIGELLSGVLPRYRALARRGQIELSLSPYGHPILPLLIDLSVAREAMPNAPLPTAAASYPGGLERAHWHMYEALPLFERSLAARPSGCWPSEGAISAATLELLNHHGCRWVASGGAVLHGCLANSEDRVGLPEPAGWNRAWQVEGQQLRCYFRDDALSDLIGFTYSTWHADDAVQHFVRELERVAQDSRRDGGDLLLIALDGENAWEHYPFNGYYFLRGLYRALTEHPWLTLTTLSRHCATGAAPLRLPRVRAGSWVHGTLATWIGSADKNAGWNLLIEAKRAVDTALAGGTFSALERRQIELQLGQCESSDWFWWFGDYNPAEAVREFDQLYRHQLTRLYEMLRLSPPQALSQVISIGRGAPEGGGVMQRAR
jgi:alpha-amylase/alpha-mannosidase (GH57 family)